MNSFELKKSKWKSGLHRNSTNWSVWRTERNICLCNLGGTIESLAPEVKNLTRTEMTELMEHIFGLPEVQRAVRHMEITHINQANRGKELKANGTIPLHSNPNETQ